MVLLTVTTAIAQALSHAERLFPEELELLQRPDEPDLTQSRPGNPISHRQLIELSKMLAKRADAGNLAQSSHGAEVGLDCSPSGVSKTDGDDSRISLPGPQQQTWLQDSLAVPVDGIARTCISLNELLQGTKLHFPPPMPKKEQSPEFRRLMAQLRAEEEARTYEQLLNSPASHAAIGQRPTSSTSPARFSLTTPYTPVEEDDLTYAEVHRQIILIINVIVSIVACSVFIWVAARQWTISKRLGLSMAGSGAVAVAEVVVYSSYVRKVTEAKRVEKSKPEVKEVVNSWVIDAKRGSKSEPPINVSDGSRRRRTNVR